MPLYRLGEEMAMTTWVDAIRTFSVASLALSAGACAVPVEAPEEVGEVEEVEEVAEAEAALPGEPRWPLTCVTIQRGGQGGAEDATIYEVSPYYNEGASQRVGTGNTGYSKRTLVQFDLSVIPPGAPVLWAFMGLAQHWTDSSNQVFVHQVTAPWSEDTVTWDSFAGAYDEDLAGSFVTVYGAAARQVRISSLVSRWVSGAVPNHGVLLAEVGPSYHTFASSEHSDITQRPYLRVCYLSATPPDSAR